MNARPVAHSLEEIAARGIRIPPQPRVLAELEGLIGSDDCDAPDVAELVGRDASLSAMLFKVARSPLFGGLASLTTLEQAVVRIGFRQTLNIARAVALSTSLSHANQRAYQLFWTRSRELAELAAQIAEERVSVCNIFPDQAYMAGIFFECGVPVLMQRFPDYCDALLRDNRLDFPSLQEEDQRFNVDHCSIGYLVARHWHLPDFVAQAILYHGAMPHDEMGATRSLVAILHLATYVRHALIDVPDRHWPRLGGEVLAELCLHPDEFPEYVADVKERFLAKPL